MRLAREKTAVGEKKGLLGFGAVPAMNWAGGGTGVTYGSAPIGAQTYSANSLVTR